MSGKQDRNPKLFGDDKASREAQPRDLAEALSRAHKGTKGPLPNPKKTAAEMQADATLGKRSDLDLRLSEAAGNGQHLEAPGRTAKESGAGRTKEKYRPSEQMIASIVDGKLLEKPKWVANLNTVGKNKSGSTHSDKPSKENIKIVQKVDKQPQLPPKNKFEPVFDEDPVKEKLARRDHPTKTKGFSIEEVYYPEDFLIRGLFTAHSRSPSRRYVDLHEELAHPLSQNIVLRNENTIPLASLDGRLYKYLDENCTVRTLQFLGCNSEDLVFVDLKSNGTFW